MTQVTLSCRFAAIHLETPLLGFFRNYLPSRMRALSPFFDNLTGPVFLTGKPDLFSSLLFSSYSYLARSSQNATALAAATLSESTP